MVIGENSITHFVDILQKLSKLTVEKEAELTEINPLVILKDGSMMALDGKIMTDDNSNFRHKELAKYHEQTELEKKAEESGFSLVELDGNIAVIGNGAGLVMSTLDMLTDNGGKAACFLDVGGTATRGICLRSFNANQQNEKCQGSSGKFVWWNSKNNYCSIRISQSL